MMMMPFVWLRLLVFALYSWPGPLAPCLWLTFWSFLCFGCVCVPVCGCRRLACSALCMQDWRSTEAAEPWAGHAANQLLPRQCVEPLGTPDDSTDGWLSSLLEPAFLDQAFMGLHNSFSGSEKKLREKYYIMRWPGPGAKNQKVGTDGTEPAR